MKKLGVILVVSLFLMSIAGCTTTGQGSSAAETSADHTVLQTSAEEISIEATMPEVTMPEVTIPEITIPETSAEETTVPSISFRDVEETVYAKSNVNIRSEASTDSEVLDVLKKGSSIQRTGISDNWSRVRYQDRDCYIAASYLTQDKPAETTAAVTNPSGSSGTGINHGGGDILIAIDAGHQEQQMKDKEPNGPGSSTMKAKVTSGTSGVSTGNAEYKINLKVALLLRDELLSRGYSVVMTRETNNVSISNVERAQVANDSGADALIRIHCNSADSSSVKGALGICQTSSNAYCGNIYSECLKLTKAVLKGHCNATGVANTGIWETDTMTGTNWCQVPNTIIEMGYMSNASEDELMGTGEFQRNAAKGIADGIDAYFGR